MMMDKLVLMCIICSIQNPEGFAYLILLVYEFLVHKRVNFSYKVPRYSTFTLNLLGHVFQVQGIYEPSPGAAERIHFSYEVYVPTIPALRKYDYSYLIYNNNINQSFHFRSMMLFFSLLCSTYF